MTSAVTASLMDNGAFIAPIGGSSNAGWKIGYIDIGNKGDSACIVKIGDVKEVRNAILNTNSSTAIVTYPSAGVTASFKTILMDPADSFSDNTFVLHQGAGTSSGFIVYR